MGSDVDNTPVPEFLSAEAVMAIAGLTVRARCVADGVLTGLHRSHRQGESAEFAEHKVYAPGDDVRRIDWKAFGKSDRYYIKRFEEETSLASYMVVDTSGSMAYPEKGRHSKFMYAATLATAIAHQLLSQTDAVGLVTFANKARRQVPLGSRQTQLNELAQALEKTKIGGITNAQAAVATLSEVVRRHSLVIIFSDLLGVVEQPGGLEDFMTALRVLRARGADVALVQVLDPDELDLPFPGVVRFFDLEQERDIQVDASAIRDTYREEVSGFLNNVQELARAAGITHQMIRTDEPPAKALVNFLSQRLSPRWR